MKLRIQGDSLRLRIAPSEMALLLDTGRVEETIHFGAEQDAQLTYALELAHGSLELALRSDGRRIAVSMPAESARAWAAGNDVGVYGTVPVLNGDLEIAVEKDWACLGKSNEENRDTFPNPAQGAAC